MSKHKRTKNRRRRRNAPTLPSKFSFFTLFYIWLVVSVLSGILIYSCSALVLGKMIGSDKWLLFANLAYAYYQTMTMVCLVLIVMGHVRWLLKLIERIVQMATGGNGTQTAKSEFGFALAIFAILAIPIAGISYIVFGTWFEDKQWFEIACGILALVLMSLAVAFKFTPKFIEKEKDRWK